MPRARSRATAREEEHTRGKAGPGTDGRRASNWRMRDLGRPAGPAPSSVAAVVDRTCFTLRAARLLEAFLLGVGAGFLVLAVWLLEGAPGTESGPAAGRSLALVTGAFAAATWFLAHRTTRRKVARTLDERLRFHGGLLTALDVEGYGAAMTRLLRERVLARLRLRDAMRALFPPLFLPIAAPLLGFALFAAAQDAGASQGRDVRQFDHASEGLAVVLEGLGRAATADGRELDPEDARQLQELARIARDLERRFGGGVGQETEVERELTVLREGIDELTRRLVASPKLRNELDRARGWLEATGRAAEGGAPKGKPGGSGSAPPGLDSGSASGNGTANGATDAGVREPLSQNPSTNPAETMTGTDPGGTMAGPAKGSDAAQEAGTAEGIFWPQEYDGIVSGWLRSRSDSVPKER